MKPFVMYDQASLEILLRNFGVSETIIKKVIDAGHPTDANTVSLVTLNKNIARSGDDSVIVKRVGAETHEMYIEVDLTKKTFAVDVKVPPRNDEFMALLKELNYI